MAYKVSQSITGLDTVRTALQSLPKKLGRKLERKGVGEATKLLLRTAKAQAPTRASISKNMHYKGGLLRKSMGRKVKTYRNSGRIVGIVGARKDGFREEIGIRIRGKSKGQGFYANPTKYLHLIELGTRRSKATHFLERSLQECLPQCVSLIQQALADAVAELGKGA